MAKPWHVIVTAIIGCCLTFTFSTLCYTLFVDIDLSKINDVVTNWKTAPITGIYFADSTCPDGYSAVTAIWHGTNSTACACADGTATTGTTASFSHTKCDDSHKELGCRKQPEFDAIDLSLWREKILCVQRDSVPQLISKTKSRPTSCENEDYTTCGNTCAQSTCPITDIISSSESLSDYEMNRTTGDSTTSWYYNTGATSSSDKMPINELKFRLYSDTQKRGACLKLRSQLYQSIQERRWNSYTYEAFYPKKCAKVDSRWSALDYQDEEDFLLDNFMASSYCLNYENASDYVNSGTRCGTSPNEDPNCMMYGRASTTLVTNGCGTYDEICQSIYYQSNCGALKRFATHDTKQSWAVMARHEIEWKSNCKSTMSDIDTANDSFQHFTDLLLANMIIVVICTYFSLSWYAFLFYTIISPERYRAKPGFVLSLIYSYLLLILSLIKLISLIITLSVIYPTITIISDGISCAKDKPTTSVFEGSSDDLTSVNVLLWFATIIEGISFILIKVLIIFKREPPGMNSVSAENSSNNNPQRAQRVTVIEMN